jgi:hypothetical protein
MFLLLFAWGSLDFFNRKYIHVGMQLLFQAIIESILNR